jgi:probable biosynthetic protein (TIGR04098 family)
MERRNSPLASFPASTVSLVREYSLGMTQMLFGGLSERWFLKECGDVHWNMICTDLGVSSGQIVGQTGERLYASFTRIRFESELNFRQFRENDRLRITGRLSRFGDKRYFSSLQWRSANAEINCSLSSVFISRELDNKNLARSRPRGMEASSCQYHTAVPPFGEGYRLFKAAVLKGLPLRESASVALCGHVFPLPDAAAPGYTTTYAINPYHDMNGVSLLYFASYPRIHDICEREYVINRAPSGSVPDWALASAPVARDIYYYGNADVNDTLEFRIVSSARTGASRISIHSALFRCRDGVRIADLFTVKQILSNVSDYAPLFERQCGDN